MSLMNVSGVVGLGALITVFPTVVLPWIMWMIVGGMVGLSPSTTFPLPTPLKSRVVENAEV